MFDIVVELEAVGAKKLDAVVIEGVVGGRDHHPEIGAHRAREHSDRRGRNWTRKQHVHADRGEAGDQRGLDHVAGKPGILADEHAVAMVAATKDQPRRLPDPKRQFRRNRAVGAAADAVGAKILANHVFASPGKGQCPSEIIGQFNARNLQKYELSRRMINDAAGPGPAAESLLCRVLFFFLFFFIFSSCRPRSGAAG